MTKRPGIPESIHRGVTATKVVAFLAGLALAVTACSSSPVEEYCAKAVESGIPGNRTEAECIEEVERVFAMRESRWGACDSVRAALDAWVPCQTRQNCSDFEQVHRKFRRVRRGVQRVECGREGSRTGL